MINYIKNRLAFSTKGAKDFIKGTVATVFLNMAMMLPAVYVFRFLNDYLKPILNPVESVSKGLLYYTVLALVFLLFTWIIAVMQYRSTFTAVYDESANRRISLAEKLRKLPLSFFGEKNLSDLTSTIMGDCTALEHTFSHAVPQLFASIISLTVIATGIFIYNWQLALALFWTVPISACILLITKKAHINRNVNIYSSNRDVTESIQEGLDNIQVIKSSNAEDRYLKELGKKLDKFESSLIKGELVNGVLVNSAQSFLKLSLVTVIIVGARLLFIGSIDTTTYLMFLIITSRIFDPIDQVFLNLAALLYLDVRIKRVKEMEELPIQRGKTNFTPNSYDITFNNVEFSYEEGMSVLNGVTFCAKQGEVTALVGPSGCGKSTSAKLAARFWDIDSGTILLGDQDISKIDPETLLKYYSVVFQDVVLFNASVLDNIRIGKHNATDKEVLEAAKLAQCDQFIKKLPKGYETVLGENGETLSGGERQRISIARALLKDAPIVLLDEATASLDVENETKIQQGISELIKDKTVLVIAHRMRTVADADNIVVLDSGKVVESGAPRDLTSGCGIFSNMVKRQFVEV